MVHVYVGKVDSQYILLQHLTKLYIVHIGVVSEAFFYQQALRLWGNLSAFKLNPPASIYSLARAGLSDPASGYAGNEADNSANEADHIALGVVDLLGEKAEMLAEYLSLEIVNGQLCALPQLVPGFVPPLCGLPLFILRLATKVDWTAELPCFQGLARQLALLFRVSAMGAASQTEPGESAAAPATDASGDAVGREDEEARSEAWTIQHVLLPAIRRDYEAPAAHSSNGTVVQ
ncbi:MAG: hypothetical protein SGPRY_007105, partial [Prymnesium sp.]